MEICWDGVRIFGIEWGHAAIEWGFAGIEWVFASIELRLTGE